MATEAARLRRPTESKERKTHLTHTGLLMEGLRRPNDEFISVTVGILTGV
jgi:hypothetical protein